MQVTCSVLRSNFPFSEDIISHEIFEKIHVATGLKMLSARIVLPWAWNDFKDDPRCLSFITVDVYSSQRLIRIFGKCFLSSS